MAQLCLEMNGGKQRINIRLLHGSRTTRKADRHHNPRSMAQFVFFSYRISGHGRKRGPTATELPTLNAGEQVYCPICLYMNDVQVAFGFSSCEGFRPIVEQSVRPLADCKEQSA